MLHIWYEVVMLMLYNLLGMCLVYVRSRLTNAFNSYIYSATNKNHFDRPNLLHAHLHTGDRGKRLAVETVSGSNRLGQEGSCQTKNTTMFSLVFTSNADSAKCAIAILAVLDVGP